MPASKNLHTHCLHRKLIVVLAVLAYSFTVHAQVVINELVQSNIDGIMDDLNEFPDSWVELYNAGATSVETHNLRLSPTPDIADSWQLTYGTLAPKERLLVYCDKAAKGLHAHFRLESGKGGTLYLFNNNVLTDSLTDIPRQLCPGAAWGRLNDGDAQWGWLLTPTPGQPNCGNFASGILSPPIFSQEGCVVTGSPTLSIALTLPDDAPSGTVIRYTIDGSEPTSASPVCREPLILTDTRIIRARCFCDGWISPPSTAHSYIFFPRKLTLPVVSIITDQRYFDDKKIGIYVDGTSSKKNYENNWRRPINFELFETTDVPAVINQLCETRICGGATRSAQLKSLALYANKRFGTKHFNYEFFPDQRPGIDEYKSIVLRNAGNDFDYLYMRDAIIQRTMASHVDLDWQAWRPVIFYLNGVYKGMLNIRERANENNIWSNYDHLEDIDLIENWNELKEGDKTEWKKFQDFYAGKNQTREDFEQQMDCTEFLNLMIMNLFYNNQDFPGNNIVMWRPRTPDGRWRFVAKDTDFGLGLYGSSPTYDTMAWLYNPSFDADRAWANTSNATRLFRRMMDNAELRDEFIDRCAVYMGDFMNATGTRAVWDPMYEQIREEYPHHRKLINQWWPNYSNELTSARGWVSLRPAAFLRQLANQYALGTPTQLNINASRTADELDDILFSVNGIPLSQGIFNGKMFGGRTVTLTATPLDGRVVASWTTVQNGPSGTVTTTHEGSTLTFVMPNTGSIRIEATLADDTAVESLPFNPADNPAADPALDVRLRSSHAFDLFGRPVNTATYQGIVIIDGRRVLLDN